MLTQLSRACPLRLFKRRAACHLRLRRITQLLMRGRSIFCSCAKLGHWFTLRTSSCAGHGLTPVDNYSSMLEALALSHTLPAPPKPQGSARSGSALPVVRVLAAVKLWLSRPACKAHQPELQAQDPVDSHPPSPAIKLGPPTLHAPAPAPSPSRIADRHRCSAAQRALVAAWPALASRPARLAV